MKIFVIAGRLIRQIAGDKRTLVVMLIAPMLIMSLLYFLLGNGVSVAKIDIVSVDYEASETMQDIAVVTLVSTEQEAIDRLEDGKSDGYIAGDRFVVEGSDPSLTALSKRAFMQYAQEKKFAGMPPQFASQAEGMMQLPDAEYYHGSEDYDQFDFLAAEHDGLYHLFPRVPPRGNRVSARTHQRNAGSHLGFLAAAQSTCRGIFPRIWCVCRAANRRDPAVPDLCAADSHRNQRAACDAHQSHHCGNVTGDGHAVFGVCAKRIPTVPVYPDRDHSADDVLRAHQSAGNAAVGAISRQHLFR